MDLLAALADGCAQKQVVVVHSMWIAVEFSIGPEYQIEQLSNWFQYVGKVLVFSYYAYS